MPEHPVCEETLAIIKEIETDPRLTQRALALRAGFSLGKTNYLLKELAKKGMIKVRSFSENSHKLKKINYILTQKGLEEKLRLVYYFLKMKEAEYQKIRKEWEAMGRPIPQKQDLESVGS